MQVGEEMKGVLGVGFGIVTDSGIDELTARICGTIVFSYCVSGSHVATSSFRNISTLQLSLEGPWRIIRRHDLTDR